MKTRSNIHPSFRNIFEEIFTPVSPPVEKDERQFSGAHCPECLTRFEHEPGWHGTDDQPASEEGFYCPNCQTWEKL